MNEPTTTQLDHIRHALRGDLGDDQQRIATEGLSLVALLLQKNADYGGSAWQSPVLAPGMTAREAIQCRMSDKIQRLQRLLGGKAMQVNEPMQDTMQDLAGYALLWLGAPHS